MDTIGQFETILNECGFLRLERLATDRIVGSASEPGVLQHYFSLGANDGSVVQDIQINPHEMRIGDNTICLHTLSDLDDLPQTVSTDTRYERLSTDRSDSRLSFAAPVGLLLSCNHVYNQYIFIDNHEETLRKFERTARNMNSLSRYSRANALNKE